MENQYTIRNARPDEFLELGKLMVQVYSQLEKTWAARLL
jgi:hypothetical protein